MTLRTICLALVLTVAGGSAAAREGMLGPYVDLLVGAKGTVGGNVWTEPTTNSSYIDIAMASNDLGFSRTRGGYGVGGGLWLEARFVRFVALEVDLLYEQDRVWENDDFSGAKAKFTAVAHNLRIPVLVKGVLPLPSVRIAFGLGPEFVVPLDTSGEESPDWPNIHFTAKGKTSTMLTFGFSFVFSLPFNLVLPLDLRAAKNLTQPSAYDDRVAASLANNVFTAEMTYQNSWDFRLLLGLGYEL